MKNRPIGDEKKLTFTLSINRDEFRKFARRYSRRGIDRTEGSLKNRLAVVLERGMREMRETGERVDYYNLQGI